MFYIGTSVIQTNYRQVYWLNRLCMCICVCYQEMIEALREHVVHMLHTHDGSRVAMFCLWHGTSKVRSRVFTLRRGLKVTLLGVV